MTMIIALLIGILVFSFIVILFSEDGSQYDLIRKRLLSISISTNNDTILDEDYNKPITERFFKPLFAYIINILKKYIPNVNDNNNQKSENLRKSLRRAGITMSVNEYQVFRILVIIGSSIFFFIISLLGNMINLMVILMPFFGAYSAFSLMRFSLMSKITKRKEQMERQLPDIIDMISVSVEAGLGLEQAISHVINEFKGPLADEFTITFREMSMGRSRKDALILLGERCEIDDLKSLSGSVIQASRMGISLKSILRAQSASIRQGRRNRIQEKAAKISVKMLIPMVLFILPVLFIVIMGPAVVHIIELFGSIQ